MQEKKEKRKITPVFRLARPEEEEKVIRFVNDNFDWKLPLVNRADFFEYYYKTDGLQFALAELGNDAGICGAASIAIGK